MATWLRKSSLVADAYPKISQLSSNEVEDAKQFAVGAYPWPARWTVRLFHIAKGS